MKAVECENLRRTFAVHKSRLSLKKTREIVALNNVNFSVNKGMKQRLQVEEGVIPRIMTVLTESHTKILSMNVRESSLEDVFIEMTSGD